MQDNFIAHCLRVASDEKDLRPAPDQSFYQRRDLQIQMHAASEPHACEIRQRCQCTLHSGHLQARPIEFAFEVQLVHRLLISIAPIQELTSKSENGPPDEPRITLIFAN